MRSLNFLIAVSIFTTILFTSCQKENIDSGDAITIISGQDFLDRKKDNGEYNPSNNHYALNLIGVSEDNYEVFEESINTNNDGESIYVGLENDSKVILRRSPEGENFGVIDANGLENKAKFQLPTPSNTEYHLFVRPLGIPKAESQPHNVDPTTNEDVASMGTIISIRKNGEDRVANIASKLMTVNVAAEDLNGDDVIDELDISTYNIFDDALEDYYWEYNDEGLKVSQLRFYYND